MATARDARRSLAPVERQPPPWHRPSAFWQAVAGFWSLQRRRWRATTAAPEGATRAENLEREANDLLNDLSAIRGYCELTRMSHPQDDTLVRRMDQAMEACSDAADSIRQLLSVGGRRSP